MTAACVFVAAGLTVATAPPAGAASTYAVEGFVSFEYSPPLTMTPADHDVEAFLSLTFVRAGSVTLPSLPNGCLMWGGTSGSVLSEAGSGAWGLCDRWDPLAWKDGTYGWERTGQFGTLTLSGDATGTLHCAAPWVAELLDPEVLEPAAITSECAGVLTLP